MSHPVAFAALSPDEQTAYLAHDARLRSRGCIGPVPPVGTPPVTAEALQRASAAVQAGMANPARIGPAGDE